MTGKKSTTDELIDFTDVYKQSIHQAKNQCQMSQVKARIYLLFSILLI